MTMLSNPGHHAIRLTLSNGSVRLVGPWGVTILPDYAETGLRLEITAAEIVGTGSVMAAALPDPDTRRAA